MKYDFPFSETALSALSDTLVSIFSSAGFGVSESVTEIVQVAFTPFTAVAVIFALPAETAVITPLLSMVATVWSELSQRIDLFVAVCGSTVADNCSLSPFFIAAVVLFSVTFVTS